MQLCGKKEILEGGDDVEKHGKGKTRDEESGRKVGGEAGGEGSGKKGSWGEIAEVREKRGKRWAEREKGSGARDRAESVRLERGIGGGSKAGTSMEAREKRGERRGELGEESVRKRRRERNGERKGGVWRKSAGGKAGDVGPGGYGTGHEARKGNER